MFILKKYYLTIWFYRIAGSYNDDALGEHFQNPFPFIKANVHQ